MTANHTGEGSVKNSVITAHNSGNATLANISSLQLQDLLATVMRAIQAEKTKGRSLDVMSDIKKIIVVKAAFLCMAHALIITMTRVNRDPNYALYGHSKCMKKTVEDLLKASGMDLSNVGCFE